MKIREMKIFALLSVSLMMSGGCALLVGAGAGVGTYAYIDGKLKRSYGSPLPKVWEASLAAVKDLKLTTASQQSDAFNGVIKGEMADGKRFEITLKKISEKSTEVGVRIGVFGDRKKSEVIHEQIAKRL